jgi:hydroxyacylglutathione hydrolase
MNVYVLPAGPIETNAYLLTAPERGEAVLIDAPGEVWPAVAERLAADGVKLTELWITHGHWDHTQGGAEVVRQSGATVSAHPADRVLIETPEVMSAFLAGQIRLEPLRVDRWLNEGDRLQALGLDVEIRHVPGHCPGNILFYFPALQTAFVGDAIFAGSVGRTDLPGGSAQELAQSIRSRIYSLPEATVLHPGHGPATTVAAEQVGNPFVRA